MGSQAYCVPRKAACDLCQPTLMTDPGTNKPEMPWVMRMLCVGTDPTESRIHCVCSKSGTSPYRYPTLSWIFRRCSSYRYPTWSMMLLFFSGAARRTSRRLRGQGIAQFRSCVVELKDVSLELILRLRHTFLARSLLGSGSGRMTRGELKSGSVGSTSCEAQSTSTQTVPQLNGDGGRGGKSSDHTQADVGGGEHGCCGEWCCTFGQGRADVACGTRYSLLE